MYPGTSVCACVVYFGSSHFFTCSVKKNKTKKKTDKFYKQFLLLAYLVVLLVIF